jgi:pSer/pThr/pTyr-binding forkhead associated (FHA) protein
MNLRSTAVENEPIIQTVSEPLQKLQKKGTHRPPNANADRSPQTRPFHPVNRQPLATLTILDDGSREEGETIRIRSKSFVIGREKGDVTIPFDNDMSSQHAELRCYFQNGEYRWYLIDLASTNGTFLRAYRATLAKDHEILLGSRWYRFQLPKGEAAFGEEPVALETNLYKAPARTQLEREVATLFELGLPEGNSRTFHLGGTDLLLGRGGGCQLSIPDDPCLSPEHARFSLDRRGRWMIEDRKSLNGIWIRVRRMPLPQQAEFQLGQQRFCFHPHVF